MPRLKKEHFRVRGVGGGHDRRALIKARQGMAAVDQDRNPTHQLYDGEEAKIRCSARAVGIRELSLITKLKRESLHVYRQGECGDV